jgi:hypothetical protein
MSETSSKSSTFQVISSGPSCSRSICDAPRFVHLVLLRGFFVWLSSKAFFLLVALQGFLPWLSPRCVLSGFSSPKARYWSQTPRRCGSTLSESLLVRIPKALRPTRFGRLEGARTFAWVPTKMLEALVSFKSRPFIPCVLHRALHKMKIFSFAAHGRCANCRFAMLRRCAGFASLGFEEHNFYAGRLPASLFCPASRNYGTTAPRATLSYRSCILPVFLSCKQKLNATQL